MATLRWRQRRGRVGGAWEGWGRVDPSGDVMLGWGTYAEFCIDPVRGRVQATMDDVGQREVVLAFVLSALPLALPLFDLEPLHASSVLIDGSAVLVMGASGAGKSSTAARLVELDAALLADDATAIDREGRVWPGPPFLNPRSREAVQPVIGRFNDKPLRIVPNHDADPHPVGASVALLPRAGAALAIRSLPPKEAFATILGHVRAPWFLSGHRRVLQLAVAAALSRSPTGLVVFDESVHDFATVAEGIGSWVRDRGLG